MIGNCKGPEGFGIMPLDYFCAFGYRGLNGWSRASVLYGIGPDSGLPRGPTPYRVSRGSISGKRQFFHHEWFDQSGHFCGYPLQPLKSREYILNTFELDVRCEMW